MSKDSNEDNVRVVIRCRPLSQDIESGQDICVEVLKAFYI
jgi:hypothetical protein